ncbi:TetR/AcrR family transcriptional regulator [Streptomyces sp. NPDC052051]|uniref:TetR/AcrR family transcriptional regulator n=1 Tax=Streptomyces sp. NPDC052051 TaxID=3154649 RepID=UPI00341CBB96
MSEAEIRRRPGGRSARVRGAVLEAALRTMGERGVENLSMSEIAARAGVHETTVYRRWGTLENLLGDALLSHSEQQSPTPDTGSLRGDLTAFATAVAAYLSSPLGHAIARTMAAARDTPELGRARAEFMRARHEQVGTMIQRAIARGEIPATTDPAFALEALVAPLHFRVLTTREPLDPDLPERLADLVLDGIRGPATPRS